MEERRENLRAADADRQVVAEHLRQALNEGRLSLTEYDDRLGRTYEAKTYADLDKLLADLPAPVAVQHSQVMPSSSTSQRSGSSGPSTSTEQAGGSRHPGWLIGIWSAWLIAVSVNVVIWLLVVISSGHLVYFWPMWVAGPWGAVLLATTFSRMAGGPRPPSSRRQRRA